MEAQQREHLATEIRRRRTYKGWTEALLATESGVSIETISRLENEKTENPRDHTIRSLAKAFGITSEELAGPRLSPEDMDKAAQTQLDRIEASLGRIEAALATTRADAAPPTLPAELGRSRRAAQPTVRKARHKPSRRAQGSG
jgi:transcriptional regulator with XRE-family HTH domain